MSETRQESEEAFQIGQDISTQVPAENKPAQRTVYLPLVNDIALRISAETVSNRLLNAAVSLIQEKFNYDHVALFLKENDVIRLGAVAGKYKAHFPPDYAQALSLGIAGWVATHGTKTVAQDVTAEPRYVSLSPEYPTIRAELCLPIKITDQTLGVIDIQSPYPNAFSDGAIIALETLSINIALALQNARLSDSVQQELAERRRSEEAHRDSIEQLKIAYKQAKIYAEELGQEITERKVLAEIWRRYEFIANASKEFMTLIGRDYRYEAVNEACCQALNRPRTEIVGQTVVDVGGEDRYLALFKKNLDKCLAGNEVHYQEWLNFANLGPRYFDVAYYPYFNDRGVVTHAAIIFRDTTERKQAEEVMREAKEALQKSEERFRQVVVSISAHIYVTEITTDGRRVNLYLSPHVEALTGYPQKKFEEDWGFWPSTVIYPDDRPRAAIQAAQLARGKNSEVEYRLVRADGKTIWVRDSARVETDGESKIIYGLVTDITERRMSEEEIRKLNEGLEQRVIDRTRELSTLYEVTAVGSEALDLKTMLARTLDRILAAMRSNEGHIHLLDRASNTLRLAAQQGVPPEIASQIETTPRDYGLAGWVVNHNEPLLVPNISVELQAYHSSLGSNSHTYAGAPMRAGGQIVGVLSVIRDAEQQFSVEEVALLSSIGDQVGVMVENARLRRQAEHAAVMEERERLARELHDSVTQSLYSLTLLAGGGKRLARAGTLTDAAEYFTDLGQIARQALREMRLLVHELRPPILEREGLVGALQQRLDSVEGRAGVEARLLVEEMIQLPPIVEEDLYRIAQEALNNALKHADATSVTVRVSSDESQLILEVKDNGKGFDPDALSDMGGIGLVSIRERAARLDGELNIQSTPESGTAIQVKIPSHLQH